MENRDTEQRRPYHAPVFTVHGTMQELTAAGIAGPDDNVYGGGSFIPGFPGGPS